MPPFGKRVSSWQVSLQGIASHVDGKKANRESRHTEGWIASQAVCKRISTIHNKLKLKVQHHKGYLKDVCVRVCAHKCAGVISHPGAFGSQKLTSSWVTSLSSFLRQGLSRNPGLAFTAGLAVQKDLGSAYLSLCQCCITDVITKHAQTPAEWALGNWTQILVFALQALYQLSHLPQLRCL